MTALDEADRKRCSELASRLHDLIREVVPTIDGLKFRLAEEEIDLRDLAEFVALERRCRPFSLFELKWADATDRFASTWAVVKA